MQTQTTLLHSDDTDVGELVDAIGALQIRLQADEERLQRMKADLRAAMEAHGVQRVTGERYRAAAVRREQPRVDWKAVAMRMRPSQQLITAHRRIVVSDFVTVR